MSVNFHYTSYQIYFLTGFQGKCGWRIIIINIEWYWYRDYAVHLCKIQEHLTEILIPL